MNSLTTAAATATATADNQDAKNLFMTTNE